MMVSWFTFIEKKSRLLLLLPLFFKVLSLQAQQITAADLIFSALQDERVLQNQQMTAAVQGLNFTVPLLRRAEARIGFNGSTLGDTLFGTIRNEDFYGIVIGPNSLRERKKQEATKAAWVRQYESERAVLLNAALTERYETFVSWYFARKMVLEQQKLAALAAKKIEIVRQKLDQGIEVKIADVLDTEREHDNLLLQIQETQNQVHLQEVKLPRFFPGKAPVLTSDSSDIVVVPVIEQHIQVLQVQNRVFPLLAFRQSQWDVANANLALEQAQNRQIFNFVQVGYENPVLPLLTPKRRRTFNNFSLRFALEVPLPGNNNPKRALATIRALEARNTLQNALQTNEMNVTVHLARMKKMIDLYNIYAEKTKNSLIQRMLDDEKIRNQMTANELLDAQITQQKLALRCLELEQEIVTGYVQLLDLKGVLVQEPLKNYLSKKTGLQ